MEKDEVNEVEDTNDDNECFLRFSDKAENQSHDTFLHLFHLLDTILPRMVFCCQASLANCANKLVSTVTTEYHTQHHRISYAAQIFLYYWYHNPSNEAKTYTTKHHTR